MYGRVAEDGSEPLMTLRVRDGSGRDVSIEAVIDTGFTGELTLSPETVGTLSLGLRGDGTATLADGSIESFEVYRAALSWHVLPRLVIVYAVPGPLSLAWSCCAAANCA